MKEIFHPMLNNLIPFKNFEKTNESISFLGVNSIQEKINQVKETWSKIRKNRSIIAAQNLDEDVWQLGEGEDLSSAWFHSVLKECLHDYKKLKKNPSVRDQTISDLNQFHERLLFIEGKLSGIRNKAKLNVYNP